MDVSRETTLSVETITQAVSSITVSTLEEGTTFETAIIEQQTAVMSTTKALNIPFKFPLSADLVSEVETPLLNYVKGLGDGNLDFAFNVSPNFVTNNCQKIAMGSNETFSPLYIILITEFSSVELSIGEVVDVVTSAG